MAERAITSEYRDPVDVIWLGLAERLGFRVQRSHEVFASYDGKGTLTLCLPEHFDADDSLAQMIFHEICHALVAGARGLQQLDWGMGQDDAKDWVQERACHRLQAKLASEYGLRIFFGVTTMHRAFWDALPPDPLRSTYQSQDDETYDIARMAYHRAQNGPWAKDLRAALWATQQIAAIVRPFAPENSLWNSTKAPHPSGMFCHSSAELFCGECAWFNQGACVRTPSNGLQLSAELRACENYEQAFSADECEQCGACCRQAFHRVELEPEELTSKHHLHLVSQDEYGRFLGRPAGFCVALKAPQATAYRCEIYSVRPSACADFELRGSTCLEARQRVGLSS